MITCIFSGMNCTLEKVLADAKSLVERLRNHDNAAEILIEQTTSLNKRVDAMKQVGCYVMLVAVYRNINTCFSDAFMSKNPAWDQIDEGETPVWKELVDRVKSSLRQWCSFLKKDDLHLRSSMILVQ